MSGNTGILRDHIHEVHSVSYVHGHIIKPARTTVITFPRPREQNVELLIALAAGRLVRGVLWGRPTQERHSPPVRHGGQR